MSFRLLLHPIGTLTKAEVRKNSVAKHVAALFSESAGVDNATAASTAQAVFYDLGKEVRYPSVTYSGYVSYHPVYDSDRVSDAADAASGIAGDAASAVVSSVTIAARSAADAEGATAGSVAAAASNAADAYAAAARANASDASFTADRSAAVAAASYASYADSYYSAYSALETAGHDSLVDWSDSIDILARAISVEVSCCQISITFTLALLESSRLRLQLPPMTSFHLMTLSMLPVIMVLTLLILLLTMPFLTLFPVPLPVVVLPPAFFMLLKAPPILLLMMLHLTLSPPTLLLTMLLMMLPLMLIMTFIS